MSSMLVSAVVFTLAAAVAVLVGMCLAKPVQENQPSEAVSPIRE